MFPIKPRLVLALGAFALAGLTAAPVAVAAPSAKAANTKKAGHTKKTAQVFYVCNDCHLFYSAAAAKKAGYKDSMGDKLVKVGKVPTGYRDGTRMKM